MTATKREPGSVEIDWRALDDPEDNRFSGLCDRRRLHWKYPEG